MSRTSSLRNRLFPRLFLTLGGIGAFACTAAGGSAIWLRSNGFGFWVALGLSLLVSAVVSMWIAHNLAVESERFAETIRGGPSQQNHISSLSKSTMFAGLVAEWTQVAQGLEETNHGLRTNAQKTATAFEDFMRMMAKAIDERTSYLRGHSERVAHYAGEIAGELQLPPAEVAKIRLAALLHDIGTIGVEDSIVMKNAPLTPEEFDIVKAHTVKGAAILRPIEQLSDVIPGVELHHESLDGRGYPYGLHGDEIPMMARVIAVADSFDAMTSARPYQAAMDPQYVLEVLNRLAGTRHDPRVVDALTRLVQSGAVAVKNHRVPSRYRREQAGVS
jgi:putative nucleotidyltransferase with HDIG domain